MSPEASILIGQANHAANRVQSLAETGNQHSATCTDCNLQLLVKETATLCALNTRMLVPFYERLSNGGLPAKAGGPRVKIPTPWGVVDVARADITNIIWRLCVAAALLTILGYQISLKDWKLSIVPKGGMAMHEQGRIGK